MQQRFTSPSQVGHVLASRRKALQLSQHAVAEKMGISQNRLSELELDPARLTLDRLIALSNLLGLELVIRDKDTTVTGSDW
ncbi:MAG: helix-turn-helix domain-containing protein [Pseudomonadota bacterium]|nr:helix-turn-helix domain-containing protein [Pseudomonadota bacterium]MDP1904931.1 helix-turn-helix domain-containing protein [Pseudomonadota bacterium]MDP2352054.1 helix-turn-helix domain-containing protein [Pseudomonadota bacterium]